MAPVASSFPTLLKPDRHRFRPFLRKLSLALSRFQPPGCIDSPFTISAAGDEAGGLRVWDLELGDCTNVLAGHTGAITALSIAAGGSPLVSSSADGTCRVWDLQQGGACRFALAGHTGAVHSVAVEPKGRFCVSAGADGSARVWSLATAACALVLNAGDASDAGSISGDCALMFTRNSCVSSCLHMHGWHMTLVLCLLSGATAISSRSARASSRLPFLKGAAIYGIRLLFASTLRQPGAFRQCWHLNTSSGSMALLIVLCCTAVQGWCTRWR